MSICIDKLPHSCGTRKGLQVFAEEDGRVTGWCFSCQTFVANPYGKEVTTDDVELPQPKTEAQIQEELAEVDGYQVLDVRQRKLRADDLAQFGVKVAVDEGDGKTPTTMYFPITRKGKTTGYFAKTLSKPAHTWSLGEVKGGDMFGWEQAKASGAYRLIITEGLEDAIAVKKLYTMFGSEDFQPAVISLRNGVNSVKSSIQPVLEEIKRSFREVVFCFDNDEPGQNAVKEAMMLLPTAKSVILPCKDANACVLEGKSKAAFKALRFDASIPKNTRLLDAEDLFQDARQPAQFGELTWPFPTMNDVLRNIRYGETIYLGSGVKMGKSELLDNIVAHFIKHHGIPVMVAKPEEEGKRTIRAIGGKLVGKVFTDPKVEFDYDAYDAACEAMRGKLKIVDLYQHLGWSTLKADIISAAALGCKAIFIDPITNLTNGMNAADANTKLQEIAQELSFLAKDLNVVIFIFCHLKAPEGAISRDARRKKYEKNEYVGLGQCPHEFGGDIYSAQFAGSRAMMRSCNLMIGLEGNKDEELPEHIRKMRWLNILEDREFGNAMRIPIIYNKTTGLYREVQ